MAKRPEVSPSDRDQIPHNMPLRLDHAVKIAFPYGGLTVSGLRRERDAGRLQVMRIAGKEFVTLEAIDEMLVLCRMPPKAPVSTPPQPQALGSSETERLANARDAALATVQKLKDSLASKPTDNTRPTKSMPPRRNARS